MHFDCLLLDCPPVWWKQSGAAHGTTHWGSISDKRWQSVIRLIAHQDTQEIHTVTKFYWESRKLAISILHPSNWSLSVSTHPQRNHQSHDCHNLEVYQPIPIPPSGGTGSLHKQYIGVHQHTQLVNKSQVLSCVLDCIDAEEDPRKDGSLTAAGVVATSRRTNWTTSGAECPEIHGNSACLRNQPDSWLDQRNPRRNGQDQPEDTH